MSLIKDENLTIILEIEDNFHPNDDTARKNAAILRLKELKVISPMYLFYADKLFRFTFE